MRKIFFLCLIISVFSVGLVSAKDLMEPVNSSWKLCYGDDIGWAVLPLSSVSSWENIRLPSPVSVGGRSDMFWLKSRIEIPDSLKNQQFYLELGRCTAALEIYVNGVLMGHHGTIEPKFNVSHVANTLVYIPPAFIKNGAIEVSIRCKAASSHGTFEQFYLVDKARYYKTFLFQGFFNTTVYFMMAAVCLFLGLYFVFQYISDKSEKASRSFSITLFTIAIYFFDIATDVTFIPFIWQLSFSRLCLVYSVGCITIFIRQFFKLPYKKLRAIVLGILFLVSVAYIYCAQDLLMHEQIFTISLIPIFAGIIYLYYVLIKAALSHTKNARKILLGVSIGLCFGIYDIVYQIRGAVPFAWLQGFSFFFIDATMFFVVAVENLQNKAKVSDYIKTTSEQKDKLNEVLEAAAKLSAETMEISSALDESVVKVASSVDLSVKEAENIGNFIEKQNDAVKSTSSALGNLVESVHHVTSEVQSETNVMSEAVEETKLMIDGVNQVADAINAAAEFSSSLGDLTKASSNDVAQLVEAMESIKDSSGQILGVVQIVTDFAQQTNMLAMNASIEAAHAGISGKGFGVIAHEIKTLAAASSTQAEKIKDIVTQIDESIGRSFDLSLRVKDALGKVSAEAAGSARQINESVESMQVQRRAGKRITEATVVMSDSANKVKEETDQQYAYSQQASSNMNELAEVAQQAKETVVDMNARNRALQEQTTALQQLAHRAKDAAEGLNRLIAK